MERSAAGPYIELTGDRVAVVDGCDGVVDYGEDGIVLRAGRLIISFCGRSLKLKRLTESSAVIEGRISALSYKFSGKGV